MTDEDLSCYARLLVEHGVGLRKDQQLFILGQVAHRHLAAHIAEVAYRLDAAEVRCRLVDPLLSVPLIRCGRMEHVQMYHDRDQCWYNEIVRSRGALICLAGEEFPHLMARLAGTHPDRHSAFIRSLTNAATWFKIHGMNRRLCPFVVAACPTPAWAKIVYPELGEAEATYRLAAEILRVTYADKENALELAAEKNRQVKARCRALNELEITTIQVSGGKTDLRVGLSRHARWEGGSQETIPGQIFYPNIPSEEVFTTPDQRRTQGRLAATMPFRTEGGLLVRDLVLHFRDGRVVAFDAKEGREGFARWLDTDEGARYLGEFALVGQDSPISQSGRFFDLRVYDENASSHVALGQAWEFGLAGAESMTPAELEEMGFNHSTIHTDIMFGSTEVNIVATESREGEVIIIDRGNWTERFFFETPVAP